MDRAEALALAHVPRRLCPLCGRPLDVCTDGGRRPDFTPSTRPAGPRLAILEKQRASDGDNKKPDPNASAYLWAATTRR
jgi:hypothetical protein